MVLPPVLIRCIASLISLSAAVTSTTMSSADSKFFSGIARDSGTFGTPSPSDPAKLIVTTSHPAPYTRRVQVYVPAQFVPGTIAPWLRRGYAQANPDWTEPFPPFRIAGNLYYVGSKDLAIYLITSPKGHILINSGLEASVPLIRASVEKLGFKFSDIRILLISHAHWDHDGGSAEIKRITSATYMVMDADVPVVESGGKTDFQYGTTPASLYPPAKVDRVLRDGEKVTLGGTALVAHLTPGHTKGCTTWTMKVVDAGKLHDVVIVGSPNVSDGYKLVMNSSYPEIASDYERTFRVLRSLPVDIFLGAHGGYFDLTTKYAKLRERTINPFIDPAGYKRYIADREQAFRTELAKQNAALQPPRTKGRNKVAARGKVR